MAALKGLIGKIEGVLGRRKVRVGERTDDCSLEDEGRAEQERGDRKQAGIDPDEP